MTWKKIPLKYRGICKICKKPIEEGVEAWWEKEEGVIHDLCYTGGSIYKYVDADSIQNTPIEKIGIIHLSDEEKERAKKAREFLKDS